MNTTPIDSQEMAEIEAARLFTEASATRLSRLHIARAARLLRLALPTASTILVDATDWYFPEEHGSRNIVLVAVDDQHGHTLWDAEGDPAAPAPAAEISGGRTSLLAVVEDQVRAALEYLTPVACRWTTHDVASNTFRIALPEPTQAPVARSC